jgi:hypothetical protein
MPPQSGLAGQTQAVHRLPTGATMSASPVVAFRFDPDLLEPIDEQARDEHRTRRNMVERMALSYLKPEREDDEHEATA